MIALSDRHPLVAFHSINAQQLRDEAFIVPQFIENEGFGENLLSLGRTGLFHAVPRYRVADFITALSMAAAGYGIILVPQSMKSLAPPDVLFREIAGYDDEVELALAYRSRENAPCVRRFVECVLSHFAAAT